MKTDKKSKTMSIEKIISEVKRFDYFTDNKAINNNANKTSNLKFRNEKIEALLKVIKNLEGLKTNPDLIKELYKEVKNKLESDLHFFNIIFVTNYLKDYNGKNSDKIDKSLKIFLEIILTEVEIDLKEILPNYGLKRDLFFDEDELKKLIESFEKLKKNNKDDSEDIKFLSNIYVYGIIKNCSRQDFLNQLFMFERVLTQHMAKFEQKDKNKFLLKSLPESLLGNEPKSKIRSSVHLYFIHHINELEQRVNKLTDKLDDKNKENQDLTSRLNQLTIQNNKNIETITNLNQQNNKKDETITGLQTELITTNNRLEFERNLYESQLRELQTELIMGLQNDLEMELDDLTEFANGLNPENGDVLNMYINNIRQVLNNLI